MKKKPVADIHLYRRLFREARRFRTLIAVIFAVDLLAIPLALLIPIPLQIVVDYVLGDRPVPGILQSLASFFGALDREGLLVLAIALLVLVAVVRQLQEMASSLLHSYTGSRLVLDFRARLFRHVQRLSLKYHDMWGSYDSTYRIQYDALSIQHIAIDGLIPLLTAFLSLSAMVFVTARIDWLLAVIALVVSPVLFLLYRVYRRPLRRGYHELKTQESSALSVVQETLSALRLVKAFGREDHEESRYLLHAREQVKTRLKVEISQGWFNFLVGLTIGLGTAAVLYFGVRHVYEEKITLGQLLVVMSYLTQLYLPLKMLSNKAADIQGSMASAERAFSILDEDLDVEERPNALPLEKAEGRVTFRDVCFEYKKDHPVLSGINFDVPAGSKVGITGRTGAGKTTLMSLVTRFYDPTAGSICLDGVDLRDYKLAQLRNQFAIVLQEPVLFSTTIAENIAYARPEASMEEIIAAAKAAHAHDFIMKMPQGYETKTGERGMQLSGGERQRISLARAFLKDAPILILDEPTSAIDIKTEALIIEVMKTLMEGRTTFMIAHRLSTLEHCDVRLNLESGRLTVAGTPPADGTALSAAVERDLKAGAK